MRSQLLPLSYTRAIAAGRVPVATSFKTRRSPGPQYVLERAEVVETSSQRWQRRALATVLCPR